MKYIYLLYGLLCVIGSTALWSSPSYNSWASTSTIDSSEIYEQTTPGSEQIFINYFDDPDVYNVTPADAQRYRQDAQYHQDYDQDDMYTKLYFDRVGGDLYSYYAGRSPDLDLSYSNIY
jgi:hypothetical protein